jgi:hypothetical protein
MFNIFNPFTTDESSSWEASYKIPLQLNFQTESLNNIRIGDPLEKLRAFGRPDNGQPFKQGRFEYYLLGLEVEGEHGRIINFMFMVNPQKDRVTKHFLYTRIEESPSEFANCELTLIPANGRRLNINRSTKLKDVEQTLGVAPEKEFAGRYCENSTYQQGGITLFFVWLEDGTIEEIIVEQ